MPSAVFCVAGSFWNGSQWSLPLRMRTICHPLPLSVGCTQELVSNEHSMANSDGMSLSRSGYERRWLLLCLHPLSGLPTCSRWWTWMPLSVSFPMERLTWQGNENSLRPIAIEKLRPSVQQFTKNWILPTTSWKGILPQVNFEMPAAQVIP